MKNIRFETYNGFLSEVGTDLRVDEWAQKVVLQVIRRYFRLDLTEAHLDGWVDDNTKGLRVILFTNGEVYQDYSLQSIVCGTVRVFLPSEKAIKSDPFKKLADAWVKILGFPKEYPRSVEINIRQDGLLSFQAAPSF